MSADGRGNWEAWGVAIVVTIAVIAGLFFRGITGETISDSVKDIGGALIPIVAAFVAAKLVSREMDPADRYMRAGEEALKKIREKHPGILSGPKADRECYDPNNPGGAGRYLFFQRNNQGKRGQLIPLLPLKDGIVEVRVMRRALQVLGANQRGSEVLSGNELLELQKDYLKKVQQAVTETLKTEYSDDMYEILEHKNENIAIAVDFDESQMGPKAFGKAVTRCTTTALSALLEDV